MKKEHYLGVRDKCSVTELEVQEDPQNVKSPVDLVNVYSEQGTCFRLVVFIFF